MNGIQSLIDRQLGIYCRFNYDSILKRLVVDADESFYGLQGSGSGAGATLEADPPIFACRFAESAGREHILALANEDGRVAIQDTSTPTTASVLEGFQCHNNAVFDLAWMPGNMNFVTVSGDHTACLWDVNEGAAKRVLVFSGHSRSVKTAVFRPSEPSVFATGARDGHVLVWDSRTSPHQPVATLRPDNRLMHCHSSFQPKTPGSHGKRPRIDHRAISITGLVFQDELTLLSCGECDGNIKVWDLRKNYNVYTREPLAKRSIPYCGNSTKNGYTNLIVDDARMRLYASCMDDVIYCFNIATYSAVPEQRLVGHENTSFYIKTSLSADCRYLVSGSSDKHAYVWDVTCPEPVVKLEGHRAEVTCAAWCRRGDAKVVTCSDDARHMIWRIGAEFRDGGARYEGVAEAVPRTDVASLPKWGALDRTPTSLKRRQVDVSSGKRPRRNPSGRVSATKRCLADLMNAARDADDAENAIKRMRLDDRDLLPAGTKRRISGSGPSGCVPDSDGWRTPTKSYEVGNREMISPKRLKTISPNELYGSPEKCSAMIKVISFGTPTKDLPNFVMSGEAPHLRLMSPVKQKLDRPNWLTQLGREKKGKHAETGEKTAADKIIGEKLCASSSPKENIPIRRSSVTDRTPKSNQNRTLLKYFNFTTKK